MSEDLDFVRPSLGFRLGLHFPATIALMLRLVLLVPARWWPGRNVILIRVFQLGSYALRLVRDDAVWAAYTRAGAPVYAPEFVYQDDFLPDHVGEMYRGLDGLRRAWAGFAEPFEDMAYELERVVGSGDRVVSVHRVRTKARHTGIAQDFQVAYSFTFRGGSLIHCRAFRESDQALKAAGLKE
jgi:ketosteroid isomerase-like protein